MNKTESVWVRGIMSHDGHAILKDPCYMVVM